MPTLINSNTPENELWALESSTEATAPELPQRGVLVYLPPSRIKPSANQPRTQFEQDEIEQLALNIAELRAQGRGINGTGYLQAVMVRFPLGALREDGQLKPGLSPDFQYPLTMGETRWRAGCLLVEGLVSYRENESGTWIQIPDLVIPATVEDATENDAYELALYENLHRRNLRPLDEARAIRAVMNAKGLSIRRAASEIFGDIRKAGYIVNRLDLLKAGQDVQMLVDARPDSLVSAQRIDRVKEPVLRRELLDMAAAGQPFAKIYERIKAARDASLKTDKVSSRAPGQVIAPKIDLDLALGSLTTQAASARDHMEGVTISPALKRKLRGHIKTVREALDGMEKLI